ncbi:hypothetical protein JOD69_002174 [Methylocaldum sp. RMAD-M]|nr:hypothetical protein [Methylocaldum sp. RMAD-M]
MRESDRSLPMKHPRTKAERYGRSTKYIQGMSCGIGNLQDNPANQANLSRFRKYLRNVLRAFSSRSYGKTGLADVVGAFGSGELIQAFVGRQSFADEDARPRRGVGKGGFGAPEDAVCDWKVATKATFAIGRDSRPTRECPYSRYENALARRSAGTGKSSG